VAQATAGVQSSIDVESSPVIPGASAVASPHIWSWIWFVVAILVILGFHVRVFGQPIPPGANFP
jgi:hypothetical protein